jgi:hypothetical protein
MKKKATNWAPKPNEKDIKRYANLDLDPRKIFNKVLVDVNSRMIPVVKLVTVYIGN